MSAHPMLSPSQTTRFRRKLLEWFRANKRDLPWRKQKDWYPVYLAEIILQQTTVEQGLPYYRAFIRRFPHVSALAAADLQEVLKLWQGLGYYARARNMHKAAGILTDRYGGCFPQDYKQALALPGIGPYTAAAILSQAFNRVHAVVDGNVSRVITRLLALEDDIRRADTQKRIQHVAGLLISRKYPGDFNEAMMELGALVCTPRAPLCASCPVSRYCRARALGKAAQIPYKSPAVPKRRQYHLVMIRERENRILLRQGNDHGLLAGMWGFPVRVVSGKELEQPGKIEQMAPDGLHTKKISPPMRHVYSHIDLKYRVVWLEERPENRDDDKKNLWLARHELEHYPIHKAHLKALHWLDQQMKEAD